MLLLLLGWELHRPQWVALCDINSAPHLLVLLFHLLVRFHGDTVLILFAGTAAVVAHRDRVDGGGDSIRNVSCRKMCRSLFYKSLQYLSNDDNDDVVADVNDDVVEEFNRHICAGRPSSSSEKITGPKRSINSTLSSSCVCVWSCMLMWTLTRERARAYMVYYVGGGFVAVHNQSQNAARTHRERAITSLHLAVRRDANCATTSDNHDDDDDDDVRQRRRGFSE